MSATPKPRRSTTAVALLVCALSFQPRAAAAQDSTRGLGLGARADTAGLRVGRYHALLIAVENYADTRIGRLQAPVKDAAHLRDVLTQRYRFDQKDVILLRNPTREKVLDELQQISASLAKDDNLLVFFAGHGTWDKDTDRSYWLPADAKKLSKAQWISDEDVNAALRSMKTQHTLLIADACFAGAPLLRDLGDIVPAGMARLYATPSRMAMTSGSKEPVPDNSQFLKYLLLRLEENTASYLPAGDLFATLRTAVLNNGQEIPRFGRIQGVGDQGGEFIFPLRRNAPGIIGSTGGTDPDSAAAGAAADSAGSRNPTTPLEMVAARNRDFVDWIAKKQLRTLEEYYREIPSQPADWKSKFLALVREDVVSAALAPEEPETRIDDTDAESSFKVIIRYKDPVVAGTRSATLHILFRYAKSGGGWIPRSYSLTQKPPT
jgi:hypothetical protein